MDRKNVYTEIAEAFQIFAKYEHKQFLGAGYKEVLSGPSPSVVSDDDIERLEKLGWYPCEIDCFSRSAR